MVFRSVLPPTLTERPKGPHEDVLYTLVSMGYMIAANSSSFLRGALRLAGVLACLVFLASLSIAQESSNPAGHFHHVRLV